MSAVRPTSALPAAAPAHVPAAARLLLAMLDRLAHGRLRVHGPDGHVSDHGNDDGLHAEIRFDGWGACGEILSGGDVAFAEGYMDGRWSTPDLVALLTLAARNQAALERGFYGSWLRRGVLRLMHALRANTRRGARRNIEAHYDLGNDFYALWLDPSMSYSSALWGDDQALPHEAAQRAKYQRILDELAPAPGAHVLEIGCGWGGFAEEALRGHTVRLTGISLSPAQTAYARARLDRAGLAGRAELVLRDYRDERGTYDGVASIEMFEAVGERWWPAYFETLHRVLRPGGRAVIQAITIEEARFERYRTSSDFIQRYIFPGGMLATPSRIEREAARAGLRLERVHHFGGDYARTLVEWLRAFDGAEPAVRALGHGTRFIRMWRFYLAYCAAGFTAGTTDVGQYTFVRA